MKIRIHGGRLIDPASGLDEIGTLCVADGRIVAAGESPEPFTADREIDASGLVVCPGLVDLHARLREPGQEHKGTIESETAAAAAGGITTLCCPPDTDPVTDTPAVANLIQELARRAGNTRVLPIGAMTPGLRGEQICEMFILSQSGCVAFSNAERAIVNTEVLRRAMEYAATHDLTLFLRPQDSWLSANGCAHEGAVSTRLGLRGIPGFAETMEVARLLTLAEQTGARIHLGPLSTARAIQMIGRAQYDGLPVSASVSAHHLHLTELDINDFDSRAYLRPPLRTQRDREGLHRGLVRGVIGAICSDHQPHDIDAKLAPFAESEPGATAVETLLPLSLRLADQGVLPLSEVIAALTWRPARILGIPAGTLSPGAAADICIFDPERYWTVAPETLISQGHNTPLMGWELKGRVTHTLLEGRLVYQLKG